MKFTEYFAANTKRCDKKDDTYKSIKQKGNKRETGRI